MICLNKTAQQLTERNNSQHHLSEELEQPPVLPGNHQKIGCYMHQLADSNMVQAL